MIGKNLKYYRLKKGASKKDIATECGVSSADVTAFEEGKKEPPFEVVQKLAQFFNVDIIDFIDRRNDDVGFEHGKFRKTRSFPKAKQELIREETEIYFGGLLDVVSFLGDDVLPESPPLCALTFTGDFESDALALRRALRFSEEGPIGNLIGQLENKGFLIFETDVDAKFSGMNGLVDGRSYVVLNKTHTTERKRTTTAHELAHLMFKAPPGFPKPEIEEYATKIAGAFLFPSGDVKRELGIKRTRLSAVEPTCKEYGISAALLYVRAFQCGVITEGVYRWYSKQARTDRGSRIENESPELFAQLVCRAIDEGEIGISKGAELLRTTYREVCELCSRFTEELCEGVC